MRTFIKKDLVEKVMMATGYKQRLVEQVMNALFHALKELMTEANPYCRIEIRNFGVFEVKPTRERRNARNPRQPEKEFYIPPRRKVHFKPGGTLKKELYRPLSLLSS